MRLLQKALILGLIVLAGPSLSAGQAFKFRVRNKVIAGRQTPAIVLTANMDMHNIRLNLTRSDGKRLSFKARYIKSGQTRQFKFKQKKGRFSYRGKLTAKGMSEPFLLSFDCLVVDPLKIKVTKAGVDLDAGRIRFRVNRWVAATRLKVLNKDNGVIYQGQPVPKPESAVFSGGFLNYRVTFPKPSQPVGMAQLDVLDRDGFYAGVQMEPFFIQIPHQEVEFAFGKWTIDPDQEPKLKQSLVSIHNALKKLKTDFRARLYIAGYTDTVGSDADNMRLSTNRARAIARWFLHHGVGIAVFYQGFGEKVLRVSTQDNTPESRNRRVVYVLSAQAPGPDRAFPATHWKRAR